MGRIIRNGIEYGSGGTASNIVYLTQEAYDTLPDDKLTDGIEYRITDANTDSTKARNIAYDNSESGIEAVSVQNAIDTVNESLNNKAINGRAHQSLTSTVSIATKTWEVIGMDSIEGDTNFSISDRRIVIPYDGVLIATARCSFDNNSTGDRGIAFEYNNSMVNSTAVVNRACDSTRTNITTHIITHASAGDLVTVQAYQNSGSSLGVEAIWIRYALIKD